MLFDFVIEFARGEGVLSRSTVRSLGLMVDGDDVVFFNLIADGRPIGTRIPLAKITNITTDATTKGIADGLPRWEPPSPS